ncbi:hypothetical protein BV900_19420 [Agrobacterium tumefaciens]|nr:hypothetical protein BV900_19420 [Agrobacterium tumefaciens]
MRDSTVVWFGMTREALAEHLRRLADDIETLNVRRTNSGDVVAINSWSLAVRAVPCLIGRPVDHPAIADDNTARTSELFYFDPQLGLARSFSRWYRLCTTRSPRQLELMELVRQ